MNALTTQPSPQPTPTPNDIIIRLADEGIPVRAIARATKIPGADIYDMLRDAMAAGQIVELPKDDWPPGTARAARAIAARQVNDDALAFSCARFFRATRLEAAILTVLLKRAEVTKQQLHLVIEQNRPSQGRVETDPKMVDVVICHLRKKLKSHDLTIETVWGLGYLMSAEHRDRALALLGQMEPANG